MEEQALYWRDISPVCLIRRILREIPTILAAGVIAVLLTAAAIQTLYRPEYTASATVAVTLKNAGYSSVYSNLSTTTEIAETLTELFESQTFHALAENRQDAAGLTGTLDASVVPETNLLRLSVTADDPAGAFRTLNFLMENYDLISDHVFQNVILRKLDNPVVPQAPSNPPDLRAASKRAFLVGALGMTAFLFLLFLMSDTVQTTAGMRHKVDARLFATIHHEEKNKTLRAKLRRGKSGLLIGMPAAGFYFTEEIGKLASRVSLAMQKDGRRVLLVTSVSENEGKSTVAANLALALAQKGRRVLLLDADFHKPAQWKLFGVRPERELAEVLRGTKPCITETVGQDGLQAIFSRKPGAGTAELLSPACMGKLLEQLRDSVDLVILDSSPMDLFSDTEALAESADVSLLVVRQDGVSVRRINDAVDQMNQCRAHLLGCVFNDVRHWALFDGPGGYGYGYGYGGYGRYGYGYGYGYGEKKRGRGEDTHGREKN